MVNDLISRHANASVVLRDLAQNPPPHLGQALLAGLSAAPEQRTREQSEALALSDALVDEVSDADILVIAAPMHNFGVPSTLKAWIDHVVRAGRTFRYAPGGPQGLLRGKRAILVLASGGVYSEGPAQALDFQEPYLRAVLRFLGITDVDVVHVEGVRMSTIGPEKAVVSAMQQSRKILDHVA
jgi:FMN-dependent NADH-azoreductase